MVCNERGTLHIARGICLRGDEILLAYHKELDYYFLPGGHIEENESARSALMREFIEETGIPISVKNLFIVFEHKWGEEKIQHEINFIFFVNMKKKAHIASLDKHLSFHWVTLAQFSKTNFLPKKLKAKIMKCQDGSSQQMFISSFSK